MHSIIISAGWQEGSEVAGKVVTAAITAAGRLGGGSGGSGRWERSDS